MSDKKISLLDLLAEVGLDRLRVQFLGELLDGKQSVRKDGAVSLRFVTTETTLEDLLDNRRTALLVWVNYDEIEAARKRLISPDANCAHCGRPIDLSRTASVAIRAGDALGRLVHHPTCPPPQSALLNSSKELSDA